MKNDSEPTISDFNEIGRVESVKNEICIIEGFKSVALGNLISFSSGEQGLVIGFTQTTTQVIILGDFHKIKKGDLAKIAEKYLKVRVSDKLLGRTINPLGDPLDGRGMIDEGTEENIESPAKAINERKNITKPLYTGYLIIDSQIPIGLGQRELFVGEKKVHKADIAIGTICNQAAISSDLINIYVTIDAEASSVKRQMEQLKKAGADKRTIMVVGRSSDPASINYIAPMAGVTMAEGFARQGKDVLIIFDNLSSHARVYRQISLLLNRPPGREAYPGDIFYLHAKLLERCGAFDESVGGGSITAIPLVETQGEEITDYISTNLISITDGHVLFRRNLANKGIHPPIDSGFSVSRIGGRAQHPFLRILSDKLRLIVTHYHEVEKYLVFGSDIKQETLETLDLGSRAYQFFYQNEGELFSPGEEIMLLYFIVNKYVLDWELEKTLDLRNQFINYLREPEQKESLDKVIRFLNPNEVKEITEKLITDFINRPDTVKKIQKKVVSPAEQETIVDLLKEGGERNVVS